MEIGAAAAASHETDLSDCESGGLFDRYCDGGGVQGWVYGEPGRAIGFGGVGYVHSSASIGGGFLLRVRMINTDASTMGVQGQVGWFWADASLPIAVASPMARGCTRARRWVCA